MMKKDLVSIVMLTHNQLEFTRLCLESLQLYTTWPYELIIIDNASTDETVEYLSSLPDIKLVVNEDNLGFPKGCNQGIALAEGEYVLLLNNDTVLTPHWLENLVECARSSPAIGLVGPVSNRVAGQQLLTVQYQTLDEMQEFAAEFNRQGPERWFELDRLIGFCLLIKAEVISKIGGLDEGFGLGTWEDDDYSFRARAAGYRLICAGNTFVHHFGSQTFVASGIDLQDQISRNSLQFARKWIDPASNGEGEEEIRKLSSGLEELLLTRNILVHRQAMSRGEMAREHQRALNLLVDGKAEAARQALTDIVEATGSYHARHNLALSDLLAGNFSRAVEEFQRLLKMKENAETRYALGLALLGQGKVKEALEQVREAEKADPDRFSFRVASRFLSTWPNGLRNEDPGDIACWIERMREFARREQLRPVVTYLMEYMNLCGGVKITLEHVNRLFGRGYQVNVVTHRLKPDWFPLKVEIIRVPLRDRPVNYIPPSDVVIATYWDHAQEALQYRQAVPVLFDQGNLYLFEKDLSSRQSRWYDTRFQAMADEVYGLPLRVLVVSEVTRRLFRQNYGREPYVIPNAVDQRFFYPVERSRSDGPPKILIVAPDGPGWEFKGVGNIFEALRKVRERGHRFEVVWVSQNKRQDFSFPCTFVHRPSQEQLGDIYRDCDIYVHGSHYEFFPLPPLEAMSCGVAVVAAANEGVRGYAQDGYNSLLVPPGDPERMAEAIEHMLVDRELRSRLVEGGLETARRYHWDSVIDRLGAWLTRISLEPRPLPGTDLGNQEQGWQVETGRYAERIAPGQGDPLVELQHSARYRFARQFAVDKQVLDLGCGAGYGSNILADAAREVVGLDLSEEAIEYARKHYTRPNLEFRVDNALHCSLESGSFDVVVCLEVIEHVDDYRGLIGEIKRVLKPGGRAIISTPNRRKTSGNLSKPANPFHQQEWLPGEFTELLAEYFPGVILYGQRDPVFERPYEQLTVTVGEESYAVVSNFSEQDHPVMVALCSKERPSLSLCMTAGDKEESLARALKSVSGVVDEVIMVDTESDDRTIKIAESFGARVYRCPRSEDSSEARNLSLNQATGDWILVLNPDEELVEEDKNKLRELIHDEEAEGFYLQAIGFLGEEPGMEAVVSLPLRLFRNRKEYRFTSAGHNEIELRPEGKAGRFRFGEVRINQYGGLSGHGGNTRARSHLETLCRLVESAPDDNLARFHLGVEYMRRHQYEKALEQFQQSFKGLSSLEEDLSPVLLRNLAFCLMKLGKFKETLKVLGDAVQAYPGYVDLLFLKGMVYLKTYRYRQAVETFRACLQFQESISRRVSQPGGDGYLAWLALGEAQERLGNQREAVKAYTRSLTGGARFPAPVYRLVSLLLTREEPERAREFLSRLLDLSDGGVAINLAMAFARYRKYEEAIHCLRQSAAAHQRFSHFLLVKGQCLVNLKRYEEALAVLEGIPEVSSLFKPALLEMAFCHLVAGDYEGAMKDLARLSGDRDSAARAATCRLMVEACRGAGIPEGELDQVSVDSISIDPIWDALGRLLHLQEFKKFERILHLLDNFKDPDQPLKLGKCYYRFGFDDSAAEELLKCMHNGNYDAEACAILGEICRRKELFEDAVTFYSQAILLDPYKVEYYSASVEILISQQYYERAGEVVELGLSRFPGSELLEGLRDKTGVSTQEAREMAAGEARGYYHWSRPDIVALIPTSAARVLDVGCGAGLVGEELKRRGASEVVGIEIVPGVAREAASRLDHVIAGDVEELALSYPEGYFDVIVYGDVLEHLRDPWLVLKNHKQLLAQEGLIVCSIPNVGHISVLKSLLKGNWEYQPAGILDRTHLRFFTLAEIESMLEAAGYAIKEVRKVEAPLGEGEQALLDNLLSMGLASEEFASGASVIQYLVVATPACSGLNLSEIAADIPLKNKPGLSLCMIVKNEEEYLPRCLASVQGVVDEIIVVDTGSTDRTVEIAQSFGAKVFHHSWRGDFGEARNVSLEHATGEWILFLDADEELVEEDREKLRELLDDRENEGFYLNEINFVGDQPGLEAVLNIAFRLFRNRKEYRFTGAIHEQIVACIQQHNPNIGFSQVRINHYGYLNKPSVEKNKVSRNLEILLQEVEQNPQDNFTRFNLGVEYMRLQQYDKALEQYQKAFHKLPSLEVAYASVLVRNIALCLNQLKRHKEALKVLADAVQAYPDYTDLVFLKGLVYLEMKRYREAADTFQECLRRGESGQRHITQQGVGGYKAWLALGDTYVQLGDEREAVKAYTRAMRANARFPVPVHRLASLLLPREDVEEVKAFFAHHLDLGARDVLLSLAQAFARERKYGDALAYLDEAVAREGKPANLTFMRGEYLLNLKRYREAVGEFEAIPRDSQYFYPALLEKAFCRLLEGDYARASEDLAVVAGSPLYYVHSVTYQHLLRLVAGDRPQKVAFAQKDDREKFAALAWDALGKLLELQEFEAFEKGLAMLQEIEDPAKPLKLGKLYYLHGYLESAAGELLRAVQEGVYDSEALAILGEACREKDLLEDAEAFYSQAMALDPDQVNHYTALTSVLARQRKYQQAKEVVKMGIKRFPSSELLRASLQTLEMAAGLTG